MDEKDFKVVEKDPSEDSFLSQNENNGNNDSSGFGLVTWLFDHVREREPIFLNLYKSYDKYIKLSGSGVGRLQRAVGSLLLAGCLIWDGIVFLIYGASVIFIILGITYIFVKGTGFIDLFMPTNSQSTTINTEKVEIHTKN